MVVPDLGQNSYPENQYALFVLVKVLAVFHEGKLRSAASDLPQNACGQPPIFFCVVVAGPR